MRRTLVPEAVRALALILTLATPGAVLAAPPGPAPLRPLDERTLGIGESHDYYFPMKKGEYLRIDVEQNDDIDAGIRLFDSTGKLLLHANSYTGTHGAETLSWIAEREEVLWVQVYVWGDQIGRYTALTEGPRTSTMPDWERARACRNLFEGIRLEELGDWHQAETLYLNSTEVWETLNEPRWTMIAKRQLANSRYSLGRIGEAIEVYRSIWPLLLHHNESSLLVQAALYIVRWHRDAGRIAETEPYFISALSHLQYLTPDFAASYANDFASSAEKMGLIERAAILRRYEVAALEATNDDLNLVRALGALNRVLRRLGRVSEAGLVASRMLELAVTPDERARASIALALNEIAVKDPAEAVRILKRAISPRLTGAVRPEFFYYLGWALFDNKQYDRARNAFYQAALLHPADNTLACDLSFLALSQIRLGELAQASASISRAVAVSGPPLPDVEALIHRAKIELALAEGRPEQALESVEDLLKEISSQRDRTSAESLRASYWSTRMDYIDLAIGVLFATHDSRSGSNHIERSFLLLEETRSPLLTTALAGRGTRSTTQQKSESGEASIAHLDRELALVRGRRPDKWRDFERELLRQRADEVLTQRLRSSWTSSKHLHGEQSARTKLSHLQARLTVDELSVSFFLGNDRSYAWIVTKDSIGAVTLPSRATVSALAVETARAFRTSAEPRDMDRAGHNAAELSRVLLDPLRHLLVGRRLLLSLDGDLHLVPFAALPDPHKPQKLLLDTFEVTVVPSLTTLALLRSEREACRGTAIFALLDAGIETERDISSIRHFDPQAELVAPARDALLGGKLSPYCYLHFATHSSSDSNWPDTASLQVGLPSSEHEWVYAFEIQTLDLQATLVVLASCDSAVGQIRGEGGIGLPRSFLMAGARSVLASLWPVDGIRTSALFDHFYYSLRNGEPPASALRSAQIAMRDRPIGRGSHSWAAFQIIGDPY